MKTILFVLALVLYLYFQLAVVKVKTINITNGKIKNFRFVQISDYHNNVLIDLNKIEENIEKFEPDAVFLTGDIISRDTNKLDRVERLLKIVSRYQTFFVMGNHEFENNMIDINLILEKYGIKNLKNDSYLIKSSDLNIKVFGEEFRGSNSDYQYADYNILLVHSPEQFLNNFKPYDLVLSGHKHGGQVRVPFIGQIIDHGPKFFPKYSMGLYNVKNTLLYIDSGLGQSLYIRLFDRVSYTQGIIKGGD
ncbi:hypothetical protein SAMN00017477_0371 [Peptoniphilus asaccharolyticus DSM 20463]|uniref:Calcineurin-like phosphoesterase domain-containing protein n=1 Tax=Peptoniphilus asaccharolyticus DSM 20463 TaxID=573058 RepID=A0A1W1UKH7_PEPAS|nr:metallophosphoesterase [Peptoniphilus asaccharolyticus]SMB81577.1 hypothetical protein SAMN00017477_0371 [Peptoniphilus asaccharolyticus DSM 20463]